MLVRALSIAMVILLAVGCEKPTHENVDKWVTTQKGPGKLKAALSNDSLDPDLSAHAAIAMLRRRNIMDADVRAGLEKMAPARRTQVVAKLVTRLWDLARVDKEMDLPDGLQVTAKDLLVQVRAYADPATQAQIDADLTDWYGVRSYVGRARSGSVSGPVVVRMVGAPLGAKLIQVANAVVTQPGQEVQRIKLDDTLLVGLAASGSPDAVKYLLDLVHLDRGDKTQGPRAISALYRAFVNSSNEFDLAPPDGLRPNVAALVAIAKDDASNNQMINDSISLIRAAGAPACKAPLLEMVSAPHREADFKFVVGSAALQCVGTAAIVDVVKSFPDGDSYDREVLFGGLVNEIKKLQPTDQVIAESRKLLAEPGTVAKWVGIETLAALHSTADAGAVAALGSNKAPLAGYWGNNPDNKPTPTLGARAIELAATLK